MRKAKTKDGFTIVELVIVVAVIGILTAVLVPTFVNLSKKAQETSDKSFAKTANTALVMGNRVHTTMAEAVADVKEYGDIVIDDFKSAAGDYLVWDSVADRFAVVGATGVSDVKFAEGDALKATSNAQLFHAFDSFDFENDTQTFSIYASKNWDFSHIAIGTDSYPLTVGFDVGINDQFTTGVYKRASTADAQDVIINTGDCTAMNLTVDSPNDTLHHYGVADKVTITAIAPSSYHEFGTVDKPITLASGHVVLESGSDVTVTVTGATATATKVAGAAASIEYENRTPDSISSYRLPSFVMDYLSRTDSAKLDSVLDIQTTPEPNRSSYYRNDDAAKGTAGGADIYKVGKLNTFAFPLYAISINATTLEETVYKNPTGSAPTIALVSGSGAATDVTWNAGVLDPTQATVGDVFSITIGTASLQFKIIDGYNVTDVMGLSLFSNISSIYEGETYLGRYDAWAEKKAAYFGENFADLHPAALAIHGDIKIKDSDLPADQFWSVAEVDQYLHDNPTILKEYTAARNAGRNTLGLEELTEEEVKRTLYLSHKDDEGVFQRATGRYVWKPGVGNYGATEANEGYGDLGDGWNPNFTIEGNYNIIDSSDLKQVAFFGVKPQHGGTSAAPVTISVEPIPDLSPEQYKFLEGSNASLFAMNAVGGYIKNTHLPVRGDGGEVHFNNMTVIGNGARANDTRYQGGFMAFKVDCTDAYFERVNISKAMISFMSKIGWYKQNCHSTSLNVDRVKSFDSYSDMFFIHGTENNIVTNSCAKNAGGPLIFIDEKNRYIQAYEAAGQGDHCGFVSVETPSLEAENVYFENYVSGNEPFFVTKPPAFISGLMNQVKGNAKDWVADFNGKNYYRKLSDGNSYINLIGTTMDAGGLNKSLEETDMPTAVSKGYYVAPLAAKITINNDAAEEVSDKDGLMDMASSILTEYANALVSAEKGQGFVYFNANGNHAMSLDLQEADGCYHGATLGTSGFEAADSGIVSNDYLGGYILVSTAIPGLRVGVMMGMK